MVPTPPDASGATPDHRPKSQERIDTARRPSRHSTVTVVGLALPGSAASRSAEVTAAVRAEEPLDAGERIAEVVGIGEEDQPEVVG